MKLKLIIISLFALFNSVSGIVCPKDFCQRVDCNPKIERTSCEQNQKRVFKEHATFCGCCPACLIKLNLGEFCATTLFKGLPPKAICAPQLKCDITSKVCIK